MKCTTVALLFTVVYTLAGAQDDNSQSMDVLFAKSVKLEARIKAMENERQVTQNRRLALFSSDELKSTNETISQITDPKAKATLKQLVGKLEAVSTCLDYMWLLVCGSLVMFMQAGFALLESGTCRAKNSGTLLLKNVSDVCVGTIMWWLLGYGLAYGLENPNGFAGTSHFAAQGFLTTDANGITGTGHFKDWFFQWAFCATAATIVSGAVAERINFQGYILYSIIMTGIIYPVIVYWTWSGEGFLTKTGYSDFAGSGIVHMTGGIGALVGASILGPRAGRFDETKASHFQPHNMSLVVLGTIVLWFGWYGFNCGSTLSFSDVGTATQASLVAMNTTLAAAAGGLTAFVLRLRSRKYDLAGMCNGILAGLVAVCAGVGDMEPGMAVLTGFIGAIGMELGHLLMLWLRIDDPIDAFAVHGCGGLVGVLTRPLFDKSGPNGSMFAAHLLAIVCIAAWTAILSAIIFGSLSKANLLLLSVEEQQLGTDAVELAQPDCYKSNSKETRVQAH